MRATLLGARVLSRTPLSGGSMEEVARVRLADGRTVVTKGGPDPRAEAAMLRALATAGVPTPVILDADERVLVLEERPNGGSLQRAWGDLGHVVRALHGAPAPSPAPAYGWPHDYAYGRLAIPNAPDPHWPRFWAERRLLPYAGRLPPPLARRVERLADDLDARLPARPPASLLHGDLWRGNVLVDGARVSALIDPACYVGDAEVDLAMLTLFATPGPVFWDAYVPRQGWRERQAIYQLWPAIVHVVLFGDGYHPMVAGLLGAVGV